jgi:hypothetical protein
MNKDFHVSFRLPADMLRFQEQIMEEMQKKTSRKVNYSRFFRAQLDVLRKDPVLREKIFKEMLRIIDNQ